MKIKLKIFALFTVMMGLISCSDWIDLTPPQGLVREEFWQSKEDVQAVLMTAYGEFRGLDGTLFKMGEMRADMVQYDVNLGNDDRKIMDGNIYPDNWNSNWESYYKVINYCNEVIANAEAVQEKDNTFTDYQLQSYLGEAHFIRSLTYFYLVRIFNDVPLVLEPSVSDETDFYIPKSSSADVLAQIKSDLTQYRQFVTVDGYVSLAENKGRATKAAFDALLADIALWEFDYAAVIEHVSKIEASRKYRLLSEGEWFDLYYPGNSVESIFELQFNSALQQNNSLYGLTETNSYNFDPSDQALELFAEDYSTRENFETVRGEGATIRKNAEDDYIIWKYVGRAPDGRTTRSSADQRSANFIIYRYADVLLMKAEALSQLERYSEALVYINMIRDRAARPPISVANSKIAFEDAILHERSLELAYEGKRWFDLLRMGRRNDYARKSQLIDFLVSNVPSTQKRILATKLTNPLGWYLPIHEDEIERNLNLKQNPYYIF
ncbi:MAG: RagB/SusD family nutrient uptake outer membrane protein [Bacteroidota bacterium]